MEDSLPALSLQINVPVLSLALTVVLMVAVLSLFLAFRRTPSVHFLLSGIFAQLQDYMTILQTKKMSSLSPGGPYGQALRSRWWANTAGRKQWISLQKVNLMAVFFLQFVLWRTSSHYLWDPDEEADSGECLHSGLGLTPDTNQLHKKQWMITVFLHPDACRTFR